MIQQVGMNQGGFWETAPKQKSDKSSFLELFQAEQEKGMTAKQYLSTLNPNQLSQLQKTSHIADPINIAKISEEGARNLLAEGDQSKFVDLNNDAVTEIGAAKNFVFPPPNAPQTVKEAWEKTTADMTSKEKFQATFPFLCEQATANIHMMPDGSVKTVTPGEPGYYNIFAGDSADFGNMVKRILDNLERSLKYKEPAQQEITRWEMGVLSNFLQNLKESYATTQSKATDAQGLINTSIWGELAQKYDIHNATFDELCSISYQLYEAKQVTLVDHATLSFDPTRIPHSTGAKFYFTPADQSGRRDWIAEYIGRAEFELKDGKPDNYQNIMNHFVKGILDRLERNNK